MARLVSRRKRPQLIFIVAAILVLVVLLVGVLVLHWPEWMLRVGSLLASLSAVVVALMNRANDGGSRHG